MPTKDQDKEALTRIFEEKEAGVAEMMKLYELVEDVYAQASESTQEIPVSYTSDSTNLVNYHAHLG